MVPRKKRRSFAAASQIILTGYVCVLLVATHLPPSSPLLPAEVHNIDKLFHFAAYAVFAGLLATVWQLASGILGARHLRWTWAAVVILGALDEVTQIAVNRDCSIWDWLSDAAGAAFGLIAFVWLRRRFVARTGEAQ